MKKNLFFALAAFAAFSMMVVACDKPAPTPDPEPEPEPEPEIVLVDISVQLTVDGAAFAVEGINVALADDAGIANYDAATDAQGKVTFKVPYGTYSASATYKMAEDGQRYAFNGANTGISVAENGGTAFDLPLTKVVSQQIIIKELYCTGCPNSAAGATASYTNDAYVILYNNSDLEADASDIVFTFSAPYNSYGTNKYMTEDGSLFYETLDWMPAYGAMFWFTNEVKIPAYSQIVIAIFGAIDHTLTVAESVNLSDASYYWMSNSEITAYTNKKYAVSENIPAEQYLTGVPISPGNAWTLSNSSPAFYIGKMDSAQAKALCENTDEFDYTMGTSAALATVKFPKANIVDAVDIWSASNLAKCFVRFPADVNTGYVALTNKLGYSAYRNVDKEATEALEENSGKLVYDYAGGTEDVEGTTDPSGIDAEASIAAGAHIIYSDTNDSGKDFHQRKVASLKK